MRMNKAEQGQVTNLLSDVEGLHQLATWELVLLREVRAKVTGLLQTSEAAGSAAPTTARRGRGRAGRK